MQRFIVWAVSALLIFTNFEWFLGVMFDIYDAFIRVFNSYSNDYKVIAIAAAFIYLFLIMKRIGD
ncbi:MAG: hypothetical protein HC836_36970 [Richelia sp. RM2_1_2]|nr:hypothetical protein [Richelia sp. RM2_1_2]